MQIDWFTVGAQIVNFLVLVYLLKRFLYGPILRAMDRREERVTGRLREADAREEAAEQEAERCRRKEQGLETARRERLEEAREQAEARRKELLEQARDEVEQLRVRWRDELEREKQALAGELRGEVAGFVGRALRATLDDLADGSLEERMVSVFVERLGKLDEPARAELREAVAEADEPPRVVTSFGLPEGQRERVLEALAGVLGEGVEVSFAESADLVCGIELRTPGTRLAWSVDGYVGDLEERIAESLRERSRAAAAEKPAEAEGRERMEPAEPARDTRRDGEEAHNS